MLLFLSYRELPLFLSYRELVLLNYDELVFPLQKNHSPTALAKHHYTSQHTQHDNATSLLRF